MPNDYFKSRGRIRRELSASDRAFLEDTRPADEVEIREELREFQAEIVRALEENAKLVAKMTPEEILASFRRNTATVVK